MRVDLFGGVHMVFCGIKVVEEEDSWDNKLLGYVLPKTLKSNKLENEVHKLYSINDDVCLPQPNES